MNKARSNNKEKAAKSTATKAKEPEMQARANGASNGDLYTLRYDINEKGIGKILLPPSLSTLLQSDRVLISPAAGGLFIKSI
jgi:hypothetical protein